MCPAYLYMYVHIYVYYYIVIFIYKYAGGDHAILKRCVYIYTYSDTHMYTDVHAFVQTLQQCLCKWIYTDIYKCKHAYMNMKLHLWIYTYIYEYAYAGGDQANPPKLCVYMQIQIHIYTQMCIDSWKIKTIFVNTMFVSMMHVYMQEAIMPSPNSMARLCRLLLRCVTDCTATHCNTLQHTATHCNKCHPQKVWRVYADCC